MHREGYAAIDMVIVGAGFAGLYMLHKAREQGLSAIVIEAGDDVGGTWYWNRYPGARCDVYSVLYSYSFMPQLDEEWDWSERYATQPEILRYIQFVADRLNLRRDVRLSTRVTGAQRNDAANRWLVTTDRGETYDAKWFILATGNLSAGRRPDIPGADATVLPTYHTGNWPHEGVDFTGLDVAIIGTGSSGVQAIPLLAEQAEHLTVYQRSPTFTVPARNAPMDPAEYARIRSCYPQLRQALRAGTLLGAGEELSPGAVFYRDVPTASETAQQQQAEYERRWQSGGAFFGGAYNDMTLDEGANRVAADFIRAKIAEIVDDPATAADLTPSEHPVGTKRLAVDTNYYATFNRDNVTLVNLRRDPIEAITDEGIVTATGLRRHDAIVFATGFDAMTGAISRIDIRNGSGTSLAEAWQAGPVNYLGLMVASFPNMFMVTGPGSPSVLGNVLCHIEQHVEFISDMVEFAGRNGIETIEADPEAQDEWVRTVNANAAATLYPKANSWYIGANVPGKPRVFMPFIGGIAPYRAICEEIAAAGYRSFILDGRIAARTLDPA